MHRPQSYQPAAMVLTGHTATYRPQCNTYRLQSASRSLWYIETSICLHATIPPTSHINAYRPQFTYKPLCYLQANMYSTDQSTTCYRPECYSSAAMQRTGRYLRRGHNVTYRPQYQLQATMLPAEYDATHRRRCYLQATMMPAFHNAPSMP